MSAVVANDERRSADRVPYASRVMVLGRDAAWYAQLVDLSEGGCSIFRPAGFALVPDDLVRLFFHGNEFHGNEFHGSEFHGSGSHQHEATAAVAIVDARVARVTAQRVGLEYHEPQTIPPTRPPQQ